MARYVYPLGNEASWIYNEYLVIGNVGGEYLVRPGGDAEGTRTHALEPHGARLVRFDIDDGQGTGTRIRRIKSAAISRKGHIEGLH